MPKIRQIFSCLPFDRIESFLSWAFLRENTKKVYLKGLLAIAFLTALLASPISSNATSATLNVNCSAFVNAGNYYVIPGRSVAITTTSCAAIVKNGAPYANEGTSLTISASEVNTSTPLVLIFYTTFVDDGDPLSDVEAHRTNFYLARDDVTSLAPIALERTTTMTIPSASPNFFTNLNNRLGGNNDCGIAVGAHPYITHNLTITATGNFTFRLIKTIPDTDANAEAAIPPGAFEPFDYPIADPFLAVYQNFDPADPDLNIVGCNDDISNSERKNYLSDGTVIGDYWSKFEANLTPGDYTLVLTTYGTFNSSSWTTQTNSTDQSAQMQLWGPSGSIVPIASPTPTSNSLDDDGSWKNKSIENSNCSTKSFRINFDGGSSELDGKAKKIIKSVSSEIKRCGYSIVKLDGYTSIDKKDSPNYKIFRKNLSLSRALKVEEYIKSNLNKKDKTLKFYKRALSEKNPIKTNKYKSTRKANRRVEVVLTK